MLSFIKSFFSNPTKKGEESSPSASQTTRDDIVEVIITRRNARGTVSESILNDPDEMDVLLEPSSELKIIGDGTVYLKQKGKWVHDSTIIDVQILHR